MFCNTKIRKVLTPVITAFLYFHTSKPMKTENQKPTILPTKELRKEANAVFINGDAKSLTKSLSNRDVANSAFRSVFSDVFSGTTKASSLF